MLKSIRDLLADGNRYDRRALLVTAFGKREEKHGRVFAES